MSLFRQLLMANSQHKRRPYYCEVEYLESSNKQAIDTGYLCDATTDFELVASMNNLTQNDAWLCGCRFWIGCHWKKDETGVAITQLNTGQVYNTVEANVPFKVALKGDKAYFNGAEVNTLSRKASTLTMSLFSYHNTESVYSLNSAIRLYAFRMWQAGVLVRDFVPVLDWAMKPGMYDKVSGKMFYNLGTGADFTYGRQIHYVEWIESSGTQYIDVGLVATLKNEFDVKLKYTGSSLGAIFGARTNQTTENCVFFNIKDHYFRFDYNQQHVCDYPSGDGYSVYRFTNTFGARQTLVVEDLESGLSDEGTTALPTAINSNLNMYLFAVNTNSSVDVPGTFKMYHWSMKDDGVLVRDCYPAIDENGVAFMFDRVEHRIYDNSGTGVFKHPDVVLEYLEATGTQYIDTGVKPDDTYGYKVDLAQTGTSNPQTYDQCPIGAMEIQKRFVGTYFGNRSTETTNGVSYGWGGIVNFVTITKGYSLNERVLSYCNYKNDRKIIFNDELIKDITGVVLPQLTENIRLFMRLFESNTGNFMGRIYGAELTQGNDVIHKYTPIIRDGVAGMLDTITGDFFTNAGTGNFKMKIKEEK